MSAIMTDVPAQRGNVGLKALREKAKLNKKQMASAVGVVPRQWQRYENEGFLPDKVDVLIKIAVLSGSSIDEVVRQIGYTLPTREELLEQIDGGGRTKEN